MNLATPIVHDKDQNQFSCTHDGHTSHLKYSMLAPDHIDFYSTYTHPAMRGQGVAAGLTRAALAYAKENGFRIAASCWYVDKFMKENPDLGPFS